MWLWVSYKQAEKRWTRKTCPLHCHILWGLFSWLFLHFLSHLSVMSATAILACLSTPSLTTGNHAAGGGSDGRCTEICYTCYCANIANVKTLPVLGAKSICGIKILVWSFWVTAYSMINAAAPARKQDVPVVAGSGAGLKYDMYGYIYWDSR